MKLTVRLCNSRDCQLSFARCTNIRSIEGFRRGVYDSLTLNLRYAGKKNLEWNIYEMLTDFYYF